MVWSRVRPWLGACFFLFEALQPFWHRAVEPVIVGVAASMMVVETVAQAVKDHGKPSGESSTPGDST